MSHELKYKSFFSSAFSYKINGSKLMIFSRPDTEHPLSPQDSVKSHSVSLNSDPSTPVTSSSFIHLSSPPLSRSLHPPPPPPGAAASAPSSTRPLSGFLSTHPPHVPKEKRSDTSSTNILAVFQCSVGPGKSTVIYVFK
ncbi:hypothetical protein SK128_017281, partial [Halocaridina rubra]